MYAKKEKDRSRLMKAALQEIPCDLTVSNVRYLNIFTGEIYPAQVDILDGVVVRVREEGQETACPSREIYDGKDAYLIPGFIDVHMHVESTMMIPEQLSRAVLPWGTTTICTDPHEIGNVMGIEGVEFMLENAKKSALRQYVLAPSCVPAVPGLESSGASFEAPEIRTLLEKEGVIGIAEIMDFVGVYKDSPRMHAIIDEGLKKNAFLQGHAPTVTGRELCAYRLNAPGLGKELGCTLETPRDMYLGFYYAPGVVCEAIKTAIYAQCMLELLGKQPVPRYCEDHNDIVTCFDAGTADALIGFCQGIQAASPVDSYAAPEPSPEPGYTDEVVMASGSFTQGSTIELSCDGPLREPYTCYLQGGLNFAASRAGVLLAIQKAYFKD